MHGNHFNNTQNAIRVIETDRSTFPVSDSFPVLVLPSPLPVPVPPSAFSISQPWSYSQSR